MRGPRPLRDTAVYLTVRTVLLGLSLLPRRTGRALGRGLGRVFYFVSPRHRRIALDNLRLRLGTTHDARARRRIARACFAHAGEIFLDAAYFKRLLREPTERLVEYEGTEHLRSAAALGRGVLVFSGHFGHWELISLLQHRLGLPMAMLVRPLDNRRLDALSVRLRRLGGNSVISKYNAARGVLRTLRGGGAVAILIDQNVRGEGGLFVEFFGETASTTPALATFALKSGAPIVPVFSYPLPDGRLKVRYFPAILPQRQGDIAADILALTQDCTALLEQEIRRRPECWLWMHNRWRTRPAQAAAALRTAAPTLEPPLLAEGGRGSRAAESGARTLR
ncbi:MAG TPA: lysophospholipid acyltransferase family protein [Candidatus Polarisedimenticolia bacterium]|nr:lysophospholipid acyltransferase family protein [Candidatus Polarisedimenticolia bacterium]